MKQVVQPLHGGRVRVVEVPAPTIDATQVLVRTIASVISPGTERSMTQLAQSSLVAKARARPDLVRQVVQKARRDGLSATVRATRARLGGDLPLGYSAAGIVLEAGEAVQHVAPGDLVAVGGAGRANHAEVLAVPALLCAKVPDEVRPGDAAFATIASIALHGLRLAEVGPGARVVVVGLGLVGQLAARLAKASGCSVLGLDVAEGPVAVAGAAGVGAVVDRGASTTDEVVEWTRGRGADAVIVTAGTRSSAVMARTPALCRDRAVVVVVGDVGLELDRRPFYDRELTIRFSRSYGPGRYERSYEDWGVDYPAGHVRWTEGRNLEAVLDLLAAGSLRVDDLVTHRFPVDDAAAAYELIEAGEELALAVQLDYATAVDVHAPVPVSGAGTGTARSSDAPGVGVIGAGPFVQTVLLGALREAGLGRFVSVASASGLSARTLAGQHDFLRAVRGGDAVIEDPDVDVVVVASSHSTHADYVVRALEHGKHVFCEKPLALTLADLQRIENARGASGGVLYVGFNRRWSPSLQVVRRHLTGTGPLVVTYRVNAGRLPEDHWYHDRREGGRLIGEVCHFVDACAAIVGAAASEVTAFGSGGADQGLDEDVVVSLRYPDGSVASIAYAVNGPAALAKERLEVVGRGRSATIEDFRSVSLDGGRPRRGRQDKGFVAQLGAFREAVRRGGADSTWAVDSMRTTLLAAQSLRPPWA